jgi:hypothetical protein
MSGKGKLTCANLLEAAEQKAQTGKITERALTVLEEIIAIRKNEEEVETQRNHGEYQVLRISIDVLILSDGITATGAPDEEPNWELLQVSWLASKDGRGRSPVRSPEDQIEEISPTSPSVEPSSGFTPSSHPSTSEAPAKPMYYRGSPEDQIDLHLASILLHLKRQPTYCTIMASITRHIRWLNLSTSEPDKTALLTLIPIMLIIFHLIAL